MPIVVRDLSEILGPPRKRWTRPEYEALSSIELLNQQRLELIEGELINKTGKGRAHVNALVLLREWLASIFGTLCVIPGSPIDVAPKDNPTSEPQPDLIVQSRDITHFTERNPGPEDLYLVIEIGDASLSFDLSTKAGLYARAGIAEYWVLDIAGRRMIVHRDPRDGRYTSTFAYEVNESVSPLAAPESALRVGDAFPQ
jgi:Uma2 family endonuclease